jgi:starvation-inducible DNA-binding protein
MATSVAGLPGTDADKVIEVLQKSLSAYNDLSLTLKHVHWNVVGPNFIGVHEMIDPQVDLVRGYADEVAERIATLGGTPLGTVASVAKPISYPLNRGLVLDHLAALDKVYDIIIESNRAGIDATEIDPVSQDVLIGHTAELEKFQWFVRAHLENAGA